MSDYFVFVKNLFYKAGLANVLDHAMYRASWLKNWKRNSDFRKRNKELIIPPDYFLYETHKLDYKKFFLGGEYNAKEIIEWTGKYFNHSPERILDWGCGVSRVTMHMRKYIGTHSKLYACDINEQMIAFNKKNYKDISYSVISYLPPTGYGNEYFNLIYGLSVLTHVEANLQEFWIAEMHRILGMNGILLFTTHGKFFFSKLLPKERNFLDSNGTFTKPYRKKGHRMMTTYNSSQSLMLLLRKQFEILEFCDGATDWTKAGGQDLWVVRKRS